MSGEIDIDLDGPGKRMGTIRLAYPDNRGSYAVIPVPIAVISNGDGPGVMLSGGTHGDEYEGQAIMHELLRTLRPEDVHGRLYILPALNYPAVLDAARCSPLDGGNLNRVFPGDPKGGPTAALAHVIAREILPRCRYAMDIHSGGRSAAYTPCAFLHWGGDAAHKRAKLDGARAFGMPSVCIARAVASPGSMTAECDRQGVVMISSELGGGGAIDRRLLAMGRAGVRRTLAHWGVLPREPKPALAAPRLFDLLGRAGSVMAETDGIFEPLRSLDERVAAGDLAAQVYPIGEIARAAVPALFPADGVVVTTRLGALVRRGDLLFNLAREVDEVALGLG